MASARVLPDVQLDKLCDATQRESIPARGWRVAATSKPSEVNAVRIMTSQRAMCVVAGLALVILAPATVRTQESPATVRTYRLSGIVTDPAREPIPDAEIVVVTNGSTQSTISDTRGRFDLGRFAAGHLAFRVRRLGYSQRLVEVQIGAGGQNTSMEIVLTAVPEELDSVLVHDGAQSRLSEFYQRRQQRAGFGRFLDQEDIRRLGPTNASELFRSMPGINISANPTGGNAIRIRNCQPMVFVDSQRAPGAELDEVALPGDIAAIEFYPSSAGVPAQYLERGNRLCGLILVWTKSQ